MNIYDKSYISKRATEAGFNRDTYEKVLRLVDVLTFMNQDDFLKNRLALKGGTAINLLEFDLPRLSVDIDLDYTVNAPVDEMRKDRKEISDRIIGYMERQGYSRKKDDRQSFIMDSYYFTYVNTGGNRDNIKFDINYVMRAHIYPVQIRKTTTDAFEVIGGVSSLDKLEIYGSKINALNNRAAVRDLYDVWMLATSGSLDQHKEALRKAIVFYHVLTSDEINGKFNLSPADGLNQHSILRELVPVLRKGEVFILEDALKVVKDFVNEVMKMTSDEIRFITEFNEGKFRPGLLYDDSEIIKRIENHPMAKWKASKHK